MASGNANVVGVCAVGSRYPVAALSSSMIDTNTTTTTTSTSCRACTCSRLTKNTSIVLLYRMKVHVNHAGQQSINPPVLLSKLSGSSCSEVLKINFNVIRNSDEATIRVRRNTYRSSRTRTRSAGILGAYAPASTPTPIPTLTPTPTSRPRPTPAQAPPALSMVRCCCCSSCWSAGAWLSVLLSDTFLSWPFQLRSILLSCPAWLSASCAHAVCGDISLAHHCRRGCPRHVNARRLRHRHAGSVPHGTAEMGTRHLRRTGNSPSSRRTNPSSPTPAKSSTPAASDRPKPCATPSSKWSPPSTTVVERRYAHKRITVLYKLKRGTRGLSRGKYCARVAGILTAVADDAERAADNLERHINARLACNAVTRLAHCFHEHQAPFPAGRLPQIQQSVVQWKRVTKRVLPQKHKS